MQVLAIAQSRVNASIHKFVICIYGRLPYEMCSTRYQEKNKDIISKFAIDLINIKRQEEHHIYACLCGVNHLFDVQYLVWIRISCCPSTSGTPASVSKAIIFCTCCATGNPVEWWNRSEMSNPGKVRRVDATLKLSRSLSPTSPPNHGFNSDC